MNAADKKYLWFTIWLFVLLGLVGLGAVLYRPLRLRYAIYKVEQAVKAKPHIDLSQGETILCLLDLGVRQK